MSKLYNVLLKFKNAISSIDVALATKLDKNAIITAYQGNITGANVPSATYINITSITLEAGIWAMSGTLKFAADTKGYRAGCINSSSKIWTDESGFQIAPSPTDSTYAQTTKIVTPTETTTYYLIAYHTSTSSIKTSGYLRAVRLKDSADSSSSTSGSGGGDSTSGVATTNYELLNNKPSIESVELSGNKTFDDFGLTEVDDDTVLAAFNSVFGS